MGGGDERVKGGCKSELTSIPVELCWLSPPVGLKLKDACMGEFGSGF